MPSRVPHPKNVLGDFYVEDGCCASCNMPFTVAPDLFGSADGHLDGHCFVRKQPKDDEELARMVQAMQVSDLRCTRYRGSDRVIQIHLVESGEGAQCDFLDSELKAKTQDVEAKRAAAYAIWKARQG